MDIYMGIIVHNGGDNQRAGQLSSLYGLYEKPHSFSRLVHPFVSQYLNDSKSCLADWCLLELIANLKPRSLL
jgi:hypothetical protein